MFPIRSDEILTRGKQKCSFYTLSIPRPRRRFMYDALTAWFFGMTSYTKSGWCLKIYPTGLACQKKKEHCDDGFIYGCDGGGWNFRWLCALARWLRSFSVISSFLVATSVEGDSLRRSTSVISSWFVARDDSEGTREVDDIGGRRGDSRLGCSYMVKNLSSSSYHVGNHTCILSDITHNWLKHN